MTTVDTYNLFVPMDVLPDHYKGLEIELVPICGLHLLPRPDTVQGILYLAKRTMDLIVNRV